MRGRWATLLVLLLLACQAPREVYPLLIEAQQDRGAAVAALHVFDVAGRLLGSTDSAGRALISLRGEEGDAVDLTVQAPPGLRIEKDQHRVRVILRTLKPLRGAVPTLLSHFVRLRSELTTYVLFIAADGFGGTPVTVNGSERGRLGPTGVSVILHEGRPGDEALLRLLTDARVRPQDPVSTLVLPTAPALLLWRQELRRLASPRKHTKRVGPTKI